jgi:hypothetical protein
VAVPVVDPACRRQLDAILARELADPSGWELGEGGEYRQVGSPPVGDPATAQAQAMAAGSQQAEEVVWSS